MINTDRISLVTVATGPRGSHKTLLLTAIQCKRLIKSWILKEFKGVETKVFSNYPVGFWYKPNVEGMGKVYLEPEPLNMEALYLLDNELYDCWIFVDEIDQWADRQEWQTVAQKLLTSAMKMLRKRKLSIVASLQFYKELNIRLQRQTDIVVSCREAAFSSWGRSHNLDLGEVSFLSWMDRSGVMTGYTFDETGRVYNNMFHGKRFWNCYDTEYEFDPLSSKTRYRLKLPTRDIIVGQKPEIVDSIAMASEKKGKLEVAISHTIADYMDNGGNNGSIDGPGFWERVSEKLGYPADRSQGGKLLRGMGVRGWQSCGVTKYDLSTVKG